MHKNSNLQRILCALCSFVTERKHLEFKGARREKYHLHNFYSETN